jgi:hypothetical protein
VNDLEAAWAALHEANAALGWFVGKPAYEPRLAVPYSMYAFDPSERPKVGHRSREWTTIGPTEARVVQELAKTLREIGEGRVPEVT